MHPRLLKKRGARAAALFPVLLWWLPLLLSFASLLSLEAGGEGREGKEEMGPSNWMS